MNRRRIRPEEWGAYPVSESEPVSPWRVIGESVVLLGMFLAIVYVGAVVAVLVQ